MSKEKTKKTASTHKKTAGKGKGMKSPFQMADRMARAIAEGKIEEFLQTEMPGNEKARKLARLMSGKGTGPQEQEPAEQTASDSIPEGDEALIEQLKKIAEQNGLSLDWLVNRALKVYISQYRRTGKL